MIFESPGIHGFNNLILQHSIPCIMLSMTKNSMLSLDIYAWLKENEDNLRGYIKKIYQVGEKEFLFKIYANETQSLYINLAGFIYFAPHETPETPSMFAMYLRKRFGGKRIINVSQVNFDRILKFDTPEYTLYVELFGGGNIIVVKDGVIEKAYREREWRHRRVMHGEIYEPPPEKSNPLNDTENICLILNGSSKDMVRAIATEYNLGKYAEEVCYRAGVDKNAKEVSEEECKKIRNGIRDLFNFDGCYLYSDFFSPVELKYRSDDYEHYDNMNQCLKKYLANPKTSIKKSKFEIIRDMQLKKIEDFKKDAVLNHRIGDTVYEHFQEISSLLTRAREGKVDYNRKTGKISVEFNNLKFDLWVNKSTGDNATYYYEKSKKEKEKIKGAKKAIAEIELKIKTEQKKRKTASKKRNRRFWFEKYRWFISSEGFLVIAGRDARTNEEVVKKRLGDKDLYMHADIHGAASLVIKTEGSNPGDATMREAAQFAVSMSKAWNAGFGSMSAYWVYPSQVSKMGESGEYVARGAWVIHGKRNYIHNAPLILAVGKIEYQKTLIPMCAPESAVKVRGNKYIVIEPGDESKEIVAKKIARELDASVDEIVSILPPGKSRIIRKTG